MIVIGSSDSRIVASFRSRILCIATKATRRGSKERDIAALSTETRTLPLSTPNAVSAIV